MTSSFNFLQQIAPQVSSGKTFKNVSGPAVSKAPELTAGYTGTHNWDVNFKRTLRRVSDHNTSSMASRPADSRHSPANEKGLSTDEFGDIAADSGVQADNLIGGHQHFQTAGEAPMGEQDAAWVKVQLLELLKKLEIQKLSFSENGSVLRASANGETVSLAQPDGEEIDQNAATRQFVLEKFETILSQLQMNDGFKSKPETQRLIDVVRAMAGADGEMDAKSGEIAKLVQHLTAKSDTAFLRDHTAAIIGSDTTVMGKGSKTPSSEGSAQSDQVNAIRLDAESSDQQKSQVARISTSDILKAAARGDVPNNQSLSNDSPPASQANALNDLVQNALAGQKNEQRTPQKKAAGGGLNHADSNLFSNPSAPKAETNLQTIKIAGFKFAATSGIEMGGKIVIPDAGMEEGFKFSQHQSELKTIEGQQFVKEAESTPKDVRSQTLDKIVQKAVVHFKNGQNEIQLKLKPDFLGQIRMQIITENQQVTVRILTEYPMVKELIENNVQQLKSGLQQYGLEIDELEVSVAHDSEQHVADRQKTSGSDQQNPTEDGDIEEKNGSEKTAASASQAFGSEEKNVIDFFA